MSWNTWNSQDFLLVDKNLPLNAPFRARLETGLSLIFFARPDQFTPNSFKTTLFPPELTRTPPKHPENEGRKHTKEGDFCSKQGKK